MIENILGGKRGDKVETQREIYRTLPAFCGFYSIYERRQKHTKYIYN